MPPPHTPSPWHRDVREPYGPLPRVPHAIEQTWLTEVDPAVHPAQGKAQRPIVLQQRAWRRVGALRGIMRRALTWQRIAQVQSVLYLATGLWLALPIHAAPRLWPLVALRLAVSGVLGRLSWRREPSSGAAWLGAGSAAWLTVGAGAQLSQAPLSMMAGIDIMVHMGLVGWWLACLVERRQLTRLDRSLQPRPGRPLYH